MNQTEPKREVIFHNAIRVVKVDGAYHVWLSNHNDTRQFPAYPPCVDVLMTIKSSMQDVVTWLEFNWPVGTKVRWMVCP